jgi:uncharacterized protein (DUF1501 family)
VVIEMQTKRRKVSQELSRKGISRRDFIRASSGYAALASASLTSSALGLGMVDSAAAAIPTDGYKALVCIFLNGGADSFNLLVPTNDVEYTDYQTARGSLALPKEELLGIGDGADASRSYGLHPGLAEMRGLYESGNLAFVANVGTLVEPIDLAGFFDNQQRPLGLYSHNDQRGHWQSADPRSRNSRTGWVGRMTEIFAASGGSNSSLFANIAVGATTLLQTGSMVSPYVITSLSGVKPMAGYGAAGSGNGLDGVYTAATDQLLAAAYPDLLRKTYADNTAGAIDAAFEYQAATAGVNIETPFPATVIGGALQQVAKAISARAALGQNRQVFFVNMPGWDHHDNLITGMGSLVPQLSQAMQAFYNATAELGVSDRVVSFTASDFGRTLSSNGDGSDHAWGGNQMVMGGAVNGGALYGAYPESLVLGNDLDVGRGRLIPTTSTDEYNAELARWFGILNDDHLEAILPNIRNFYAPDATGYPLGMLG